MLAALDQEDPEDWKHTSDPVFEDVIFGLIGNNTKFRNPFSLTELVRKRMIEEAELTGTRAIRWALSSYDKVGGENTLRGIWAALKDLDRVSGVKRDISTETGNDTTNKTKGGEVNDESTDREVFRVGDTVCGLDASLDTHVDPATHQVDSVPEMASGEIELAEIADLSTDSAELDFPPAQATTSSESSFDSGHSDLWSFTPSVVQVVNSRCNGATTGIINQAGDKIVTVTGPVTSFSNGYTEDKAWTSGTESELSDRSSSGYGVADYADYVS